MSKVDHKATRQAMTEQAAAFIANPAGWPAAMAARALRLRAGHPAYSPNNNSVFKTDRRLQHTDQDHV